MATLKEIADLAGVSRGTVDRVLNHRGSVSPQTEQKILEIVQALDYKPNKAGIVLAAQKKNLKLGVVLLGKGTVFYDDILAGVHDKAAELNGYNCSVLIRQTEYDLRKQLHAIDGLLAEGINGLAISPYNDKAVREKIDELHSLGIPVVTLNTDIENSRRIAYVGSNYTKSGATAAGLLRLMTHDTVHIGIITGSSEILCHTERIAGFINALRPDEERMHIVSIVETQDDEIESYEQTSRLLKAHPEINALFFAAGGVYGGCRAIISLGLTGKLCVIAFDKADTTEHFLQEGVLSAVICQQPRIQGSKPLDLLFAYLTSGELPEEEYNYTAVDIRILENI